MILGQAAPTPDLGFLKDLPPDVARLALVAIIIALIGFYFGEPIRERLKRKPNTADTPPPQVTASPAGAVDKAADMTSRYLAHLEDQLRATERERDDVMRRLERAESELEWYRRRSGA